MSNQRWLFLLVGTALTVFTGAFVVIAYLAG